MERVSYTAPAFYVYHNTKQRTHLNNIIRILSIMKHSYYYIETGDSIDNDARFFKIQIGSSAQANRDLLFLLSHSVLHNHYFCLVSEHTDAFILDCLKSVGKTLTAMEHYDAREVVRCLKSAGTFPAPKQLTPAQIRHLHYLNPNLKIGDFLRNRK